MKLSKVYIGVDVSSTNIGYCIIVDGQICKYDCVTKKNLNRGMKFEKYETIRVICSAANTFIVDYLETRHHLELPMNMVIELPKGKFKQQISSDLVHYAIGCFSADLRDYFDIKLRYLTPMAWKKWFVDNALSDKFTVQQKVAELVGEFIENDNITDAIGIAYTAMQLDQANMTKLFIH